MKNDKTMNHYKFQQEKKHEKNALDSLHRHVLPCVQCGSGAKPYCEGKTESKV